MPRPDGDTTARLAKRLQRATVFDQQETNDLIQPQHRHMEVQLDVCVVLLETGSNQRYVFGSNKIKEVIGGSFLLEEVVGGLLNQVIAELSQPPLDSVARAKPIVERDGIEVIQQGSGKALLLIDPSRVSPDDLVYAVTSRAFAKAPGVDIVGVSSAPIAWETGSVAAEVPKLFEQLSGVRESRAVGARFGRLPLTAACASTGLGAGVPTKHGVLSHVAYAKASEAEPARKRIRQHIGHLPDTGTSDVEELAEAFDADWLAVVHIDGNGFGAKLVEKCQNWPIGQGQNRAFVESYRSYCDALATLLSQAFSEAIGFLSNEQQVTKRGSRDVYALLPLVFGGDDLTVVTTAADSFTFAVAFQRAFERLSSESELGLLTTACGIAIIKPKYPLYAAYDLADSLTTSAKQLKTEEPPGSSLDVHVLHDSIASQIDPIRERLTVGAPNEVRLWGGPYAVSEQDPQWTGVRHVCELSKRWRALAATQDGKRVLARGVVKRLRDELFENPGIHKQTLEELQEGSGHDHPIVEFIEDQHDGPSLLSDKRSTAFLDVVAMFDAGVDLSLRLLSEHEVTV